MTYEYYKTLLGEYINLGRSREQLLGEIGYPAEIPFGVDEFVKAISIIAAAADGDIKVLIELSGLKGTEFARKYMIPYSTVCDWSQGNRKPPEYLPIMIGYILITELPHE